MKRLLLLICWLPMLATAKVSRTDSLLRILEFSKTDTDRVNTYNELSKCALEEKDSLHASLYANDAISLSEKTKFIKGKINGLYNLAELHYFKAAYKKAGQYYLEGLKLANAAGLIKERSLGYHTYSIILRDLGDNKGSLRYNDSA